MILEILTPKHFNTFAIQGNLQEAQAVHLPEIEDEGYQLALSEAGGYAAVEGNRVLALGGAVAQWPGRSFGWTLVADDIGRHMFGLHKTVSDWLDGHGENRIETVVLDGFEAGHRWVKMLGFEHEGLMRKWGPDGCDYHLYSRVR